MISLPTTLWPIVTPNGVYNPSDFGSAYVTVPMMTGIYGGNTSEGAPSYVIQT